MQDKKTGTLELGALEAYSVWDALYEKEKKAYKKQAKAHDKLLEVIRDGHYKDDDPVRLAAQKRWDDLWAEYKYWTGLGGRTLNLWAELIGIKDATEENKEAV